MSQAPSVKMAGTRTLGAHSAQQRNTSYVSQTPSLPRKRIRWTKKPKRRFQGRKLQQAVSAAHAATNEKSKGELPSNDKIWRSEHQCAKPDINFEV